MKQLEKSCRDDANTGFVGKLNRGITINEESFAGLNSQAFGVGLDHGLNGSGPNDRDIKTQVLIRLAHFYDHSTTLRNFASAQNCFISSLHGFDGDNGFFFDDNRLADINSTHGFGNLSSKLDISEFS